MNQHPYIKYAHALICVENNLGSETTIEEINPQYLLRELENGINHFRVKARSFIGMDEVEFDYISGGTVKGDSEKGIFLAPNMLCNTGRTNDYTNFCNEVISELNNQESINFFLAKTSEIKGAMMPTVSEFLSFSDSGGIGRGKPKGKNIIKILSLITTSCLLKPSITVKTYSKKRYEYNNAAVLPDLSIENLINFIKLFKGIQLKKVDGLMKGRVYKELDKKGNLKTEKPMRPYLFNGNFPNAPRSTSLGAIALLGALGEIAKEEEYHDFGLAVLDNLKEAQMYMIQYGSVSTFRYNHYIVELAKENKLSTIIDSAYYTVLLREGTRNSKNRDEYQKFDMFLGRFLTFFNTNTFRDFLAFRAEYSPYLKELLITYFTKMENENLKIVHSARMFGQWLNLAAYITATNELKGKEVELNYNEKRKALKSKALIELESAAFSAKTTDALFAQLMTRVGRLSGLDAPEGATDFMEATLSGDVTLEKAKNMIIAFMRLRNKKESKDTPPSNIDEDYATDSDISDDASE